MPFAAPLPPLPLTTVVQSTPLTKKHNSRQYKYGSSLFPLEEIQPRRDTLVETEINEIAQVLLKHLNKFMAAAKNIGFKSPEEALPYFITIWKQLADFGGEKIVFESTSDDTILTKASVKDHNFFLEFYLDDTLPSAYEAVMNVYRNHQNVLSVSGNFEFVFQHLNHYFDNVLPTPTTAAAAFSYH